jgi:hypothetical protein
VNTQFPVPNHRTTFCIAEQPPEFKRVPLAAVGPAAEFWPERVKMMQAWADYLDELSGAGKVIPLRRENA